MVEPERRAPESTAQCGSERVYIILSTNAAARPFVRLCFPVIENNEEFAVSFMSVRRERAR